MRSNIKRKKEIVKEHVDRRLYKRLIIFIVIIIVIIAIIIYKIFLKEISISLALIGLILGTLIGYMVGRMFKIFWHEETKKVMSHLDGIGVIFLIIYISIEIGKKWIFGFWLEGVMLNLFALIFLVGLLLGRLLSMLSNIIKVLTEEQKVDRKLIKNYGEN